MEDTKDIVSLEIDAQDLYLLILNILETSSESGVLETQDMEVLTGRIVAVLKQLAVGVAEPEGGALIVTTVRLPEWMLVQLDKEKRSRSSIIREIMRKNLAEERLNILNAAP